jgi:hypothetical protein
VFVIVHLSRLPPPWLWLFLTMHPTDMVGDGPHSLPIWAMTECFARGKYIRRPGLIPPDFRPCLRHEDGQPPFQSKLRRLRHRFDLSGLRII